MKENLEMTQDNNLQELSIFEVGELTCALPITQIQEINKNIEISQVYGAPDFVRGVINLRGHVITVMDLRVKFGYPVAETHSAMRIIVVRYDDQNIGFLVDRIIDVVHADPEAMDTPPTNIQGVAGSYFTHVFKMENALAAVLKIDMLLKAEQKSDPVLT